MLLIVATDDIVAGQDHPAGFGFSDEDEQLRRARKNGFVRVQ